VVDFSTMCFVQLSSGWLLPVGVGLCVQYVCAHVFVVLVMGSQSVGEHPGANAVGVFVE
jgi:hypothetical protein